MTEAQALKNLLSSPEGRELLRRFSSNEGFNTASFNNYNPGYSGVSPQCGNNCNTGFEDLGLLFLLFFLFGGLGCGCWW
ncbi:hypothetical protein [Clostridium sp. UBA4548]|uniref:hypothetical protein n=1 Tax=Clostridium sp. UBA4548 TaxID=1946361 RepID=UPI0025BCB584|nr:hypothetical protein [Clostridium sp. UBA4548]